jgi:hypothetical protein
VRSTVREAIEMFLCAHLTNMKYGYSLGIKILVLFEDMIFYQVINLAIIIKMNK